ncbi:PaaI family thioesterase [Mycobacterium colombiense]
MTSYRLPDLASRNSPSIKSRPSYAVSVMSCLPSNWASWHPGHLTLHCNVMTNTAQQPGDADQSAPARIHRSDPRSPLYTPSSETGVLLCHGCRSAGRCRMGLRAETLGDDGVVVSEIVCPSDGEGGPNVAHGGWTAGMLDELVGHTLLLREEFAVTGTLEVVFHKPTPIETPLIGTATIDKRDGRKVFVSARVELAQNGALLASAKGILIKRPADHFVRHEEWLAQQEES